MPQSLQNLFYRFIKVAHFFLYVAAKDIEVIAVI